MARRLRRSLPWMALGMALWATAGEAAIPGPGRFPAPPVPVPSLTPPLPPALAFRCAVDGTTAVRVPAGSSSALRSLPGGRVDRYRLPAEAGQLLDLRVRQRDLDVEVRLCDPRGRGLVVVDAPQGDRSTEEVLYVADRGGEYQLEVRTAAAAGGGGGDYRLYRPVPGAPSREERRRRLAPGLVAYQRGEMARLAGRATMAESYHRRALRVFRGMGDRSREVAAGRRLGALCRQRGDLDCAVREARHALALARRSDLPRDALAAAADLGHARRLQGRLGAAEDAYRLSLDLAVRHGNRRHRANALNNLGRLEAERGRTQRALDLLRGAARLWWLDGAHLELAVTRANLGDLYLAMGAEDRAARLYDSAAQALDAAGRAPPGVEARLAEGRGWLAAGGAMEAGREGPEGILGRVRDRALEVALARFTEARRLAALHGLRRTGLVAADDESRLLAAARQVRAGTPPEAWSAWRAVRGAARNAGEAAALAATRGRLLRAAGAPGAALPDLRRSAEAAHHSSRVPLAVGRSTELAEAQGAAGRPSAGAATLDRLGPAVEGLRAAPRNPELRRRHTVSRRSATGLGIALRTASAGGAEAAPSRAAVAAALEVAEGGRSRALLDRLARTPPAGAAAADRGLPRSVTLLDRTIRQLRHRVVGAELRFRTGDDEAVARVRRMDDLLWRWHSLLAAARGAPPAAAPYGVEIAQRELLGPGEALLVYWLGDDESYLWWVAQEEIRFRRLPPRRILEVPAERLHRALAAGPAVLGREQVEADARALSDALLAPVGAFLDPGVALLVVADGGLHRLPFAVLPSPHHPSRRLAEDHPVSHLPSASVGVALRRRAAAARREGGRRGTLALVDAVYSPEDPRLTGTSAGGGLRPTAPAPSLGRLPATAREAEILGRLVGGSAAPWGPLRVVSGFDARPAVLEEGGAAGRRLVHVATHALPSARWPELSSLVLSRYDPEGRPAPGLLPAYALEVADLRSDLVVLAGCSTAGSAAGEAGTLGLGEVFLVAGADRVLVSLWDVEDAATAGFFERFYALLLGQGLAPAAALARTQGSMAADPRWGDPTHWAGFVLLGDGR